MEVSVEEPSRTASVPSAEFEDNHTDNEDNPDKATGAQHSGGKDVKDTAVSSGSDDAENPTPPPAAPTPLISPATETKVRSVKAPIALTEAHHATAATPPALDPPLPQVPNQAAQPTTQVRQVTEKGHAIPAPQVTRQTYQQFPPQTQRFVSVLAGQWNCEGLASATIMPGGIVEWVTQKGLQGRSNIYGSTAGTLMCDISTGTYSLAPDSSESRLVWVNCKTNKSFAWNKNVLAASSGIRPVEIDHLQVLSELEPEKQHGGPTKAQIEQGTQAKPQTQESNVVASNGLHRHAELSTQRETALKRQIEELRLELERARVVQNNADTTKRQHAAEIQKINDKFRAVSQQQKMAYKRQREKLQMAVTKGREFQAQKRALGVQVGQLQARNDAGSARLQELEAELLRERSSRTQTEEQARQLYAHIQELGRNDNVAAEAQHNMDIIFRREMLEKEMESHIESAAKVPQNLKKLTLVMPGFNGDCSYQWYRSSYTRWIPIIGAVKRGYIPTADDIGSMVRCRVTSEADSNAHSEAEIGPIQCDGRILQIIQKSLDLLAKQPTEFTLMGNVTGTNGEVKLHLNHEKIKVRLSKDKTYAKESYGGAIKAQIPPGDGHRTELRLQLTPNHEGSVLRAQDSTQRDLIVLTIRTILICHKFGHLARPKGRFSGAQTIPRNSAYVSFLVEAANSLTDNSLPKSRIAEEPSMSLTAQFGNYLQKRLRSNSFSASQGSPVLSPVDRRNTRSTPADMRRSSIDVWSDRPAPVPVSARHPGSEASFGPVVANHENFDAWENSAMDPPSRSATPFNPLDLIRQMPSRGNSRANTPGPQMPSRGNTPGPHLPALPPSRHSSLPAHLSFPANSNQQSPPASPPTRFRGASNPQKPSSFLALPAPEVKGGGNTDVVIYKPPPQAVAPVARKLVSAEKGNPEAVHNKSNADMDHKSNADEEDSWGQDDATEGAKFGKMEFISPDAVENVSDSRLRQVSLSLFAPAPAPTRSRRRTPAASQGKTSKKKKKRSRKPEVLVTETVDAELVDGKIVRIRVSGEIAIKLKTPPPEGTSLRFSVSHGDRIDLTPEPATREEKDGTYISQLPCVDNTSFALAKYHLSENWAKSMCPVMVIPKWKITSSDAKVAVQYKPNPNVEGSLTNFAIGNNVEPQGVVEECTSARSNVPVEWLALKNRFRWKVTDQQATKTGTATATLKTLGLEPLRPTPMRVKFDMQHLLSGIAITTAAAEQDEGFVVKRVVTQTKAGTYTAA